jgi:hypothetical protein
MANREVPHISDFSAELKLKGFKVYEIKSQSYIVDMASLKN